jgi:hypothetical protein
MNAGLDRELGEIEVEIVRDGAHHRVAVPHRPKHRVAIANVQGSRQQSRSGVRREERRKVSRVKIGEPNRSDVLVLQQVIGTRATLQSCAEHEHPHSFQFSVEPMSTFSSERYMGPSMTVTCAHDPRTALDT